MDPLSITTSILALLGACNTASRTFAKLRALRHASTIIDSLNNDITEIEVSLDHIDDYIDRTKSDLGLSVAEPAIIRKCTLEMDRTQDKILEVSKLLNHRILKHHDDGSSSVRKFQFYNAQKQLAQFHDEFRNARQRIISLFVQLGVTEAIKIEVLLKELVFARDESRADMLDGFSTLAQGQQRMETAIEGISQLLQSHQVPTTTNHDETSMALRSEISTYESVGLSVARVRRQSSERRCFCPLKPASRYLHSYLGRLFMGYVISPTLDSHQPKCTCKASAEVTFVYFFPTWFLNWVAAFGAQFSQLEGLRFSFFIIPVVSHDHVIWDLINAGDTEKMHLLFSTRQVSVRSTNSAGYGLLRESILAGNARSTAFLLKMGADPYQDSWGLGSPYELVWDRILVEAQSEVWRDKMRSLFRAPNFNELYDFKPVHKAVLGIGQYPSVEELGDELCDLNVPDDTGRTALSWAASRGDQKAVKDLLAQGADCNLVDKWKISPLWYAAMKSSECVDLLLESRADPKAKTLSSATALHSAVVSAPETDPLKKVKRLLKAGCEIDAQDATGRTALHFAININCHTVATYLVQNGADLSICDNHGHNALCWAARRNCHRTLKLILDRHSDHTKSINQNDTFMHLIAEFADVETLCLLKLGNLGPRDVTIKNKAGLTPQDTGLQRRGVDAEWREAFVGFLTSIDQRLARRAHYEAQVDATDDNNLRAGLGSSQPSSVSSHSDRDEFDDAVDILP